MASQPIEHPGQDNPGSPDGVPPVGPDYDQPDRAPTELPPPD